VPPPLLDQLAEGGRLVVPVGPARRLQSLILIEKKNGELLRTDYGGVQFVDLVGAHGW
jgi:protein-L-isoaspartate(D-aspartate) O-methyltransferase